MLKKLELLGKHFNKLSVIEFIGTKNGQTMWKCKCECGNETIVSAHNLTRGNTKSCGKCIRKNRYEDLTGQTFGYWKVLGLHEDKGYTRMWLCHCTACDKVDRPVSAKNLKRGVSKSCGCTHSTEQSHGHSIDVPSVPRRLPQHHSLTQDNHSLRKHSAMNRYWKDHEPGKG